MLGIIQSQKWKICVPFCLCGLILPQQPDFFNHSPTAFSAVILGQATIDNVPAEEGDWVGVFDDSGNCAGAAMVELIDNRSVFILTIYGDDPATGEIDEGLTGSEPFTLQIYDSSASVFLIHEGSYWGWQDTQGQFLDLFTPDSILNLVDSLRLNQLQVIGSHNSYHIAPYDTLLGVIDVVAPD
ncbi:MAG: phosphatidylinositol-specific phospholipase C1-like protein, partial [Candidatus Marinimicrobia bacterium]|nr:phosphatidylinositol-specific phospholipase C1-like protein [Candidatus Neomarinimicrobiota bacterium]